MSGDSLSARQRARMERSIARLRFGARLAGGETLRIPRPRESDLAGNDALGDPVTMPAAGRAYAALLGDEKKAFHADLAAAQTMNELAPASAEAARENRDFVIRAVTTAAQESVRQFIDLGAGPP